MQRAFEGAGWLLIFITVALSVVPPSYRPTTAASHNFEHAAIYLLTGAAFGAAYRNRVVVVMVGLLAFSGLIEIVQLLVPGRHARMLDFLVDSGAACVGVFAAVLATQWFDRRR